MGGDSLGNPPILLKSGSRHHPQMHKSMQAGELKEYEIRSTKIPSPKSSGFLGKVDMPPGHELAESCEGEALWVGCSWPQVDSL